MKKAGKILGNVAITLILIFSILMTVVVISSSKSESGLPNLFGKAIFAVETDSMLSEQGFDKGALIIVDIVNHDDDQDKVYKVGDVVTFRRTYQDQVYLETHRIIEDEYTHYQNEVVDGIWIHGGMPYYVTKGDNTPDRDLDASLNTEYLTNDRVVAVWTGTAIPHLGSVMMFLQSQLGFMLCVVIPTAIFFLFELFKFISVLMESKKQKAVEAVKGAEEEIKQKVIAEMLAKQEAEREAAKKAEETAKNADMTIKKPSSAESEEEIKRKAVEEYLAQQEAAKAAAREEEIKKKAIEEYLAQQAAENADSSEETE
ncbi:MAG: hypothetical protein IJA87_04595 [Clostridia bacterium]|nr:hypothetical protein [Clostridia bacterium]